MGFTGVWGFACCIGLGFKNEGFLGVYRVFSGEYRVDRVTWLRSFASELNRKAL